MKKTTILLIVLVTLNIITSFVINIIANKVSEVIIISTNYLLWVTIGALGIALGLGLILDYSKHIDKNALNTNLINLFTSRVVTIFPAAVGIGALTGFACHMLIPVGHVFYLYRDPGSIYIGPWNYEIFGFLIGVLTIFMISRFKNNTVLTITYSIGFGTSIGLVFFWYYPESETLILPTLITWNLIFISAVILLQTNTLNAVKNTFLSVLDFLVRSR